MIEGIVIFGPWEREEKVKAMVLRSGVWGQELLSVWEAKKIYNRLRDRDGKEN